jgi:hypothetical protein
VDLPLLSRSERGLPGGTTLPKLLAQQRGVLNNMDRPRLSDVQILQWAKKHHKLTGDWPTCQTGKIIGTDREIWMGVNLALSVGHRGLPGGSSLYQLLKKHGLKQYIMLLC